MPPPTIQNKARQTAGCTNFNKAMLWVTLLACGEKKKMCVWCLSLCGQQLWENHHRSWKKNENESGSTLNLFPAAMTHTGESLEWIEFFLNISILVQHWEPNCNRWWAKRYRSKRGRAMSETLRWWDSLHPFDLAWVCLWCTSCCSFTTDAVCVDRWAPHSENSPFLFDLQDGFVITSCIMRAIMLLLMMMYQWVLAVKKVWKPLLHRPVPRLKP